MDSGNSASYKMSYVLVAIRTCYFQNLRERSLTMERILAIAVMLVGFLRPGLASDLKLGDLAPGLKLKTDSGGIST